MIQVPVLRLHRRAQGGVCGGAVCVEHGDGIVHVHCCGSRSPNRNYP